MNNPNYYPPEHRTEVINQWRYAVAGMVVLGLVSGIAAVVALYIDELAIVAAAALAVFILFTWSSVWSLFDTYRHVRIVPYFDRRVGDIESYTAGRALARNCIKLDEIALAAGHKPLSSFGFNDDLRGDTLIWHAPADGVLTVNALIKALETNPDVFENKCGIASDLGRLSQALKKADEKGIRFSLLLLHGDCTSGHEWDIREGSAF